ncbi:MAG: SGNH/GDSL hydrolase family protein [Deltaproteobacteria bacterium]|nr:SGNH/GDSL hydrolase family protein [Deltaproteobacteria bacterium]
MSTLFTFLIPLSLVRLFITVEIKNLLLLIVTILLCALGLEAFIRVWDPPIAIPGMYQIHRPSPVFGWELVPGASGFGRAGTYIHINGDGFRDLDYPLKKKPTVFRIMVIGDSFTFGQGVNLEDTYSKQLERRINDMGTTSEVISCGVIGYGMWQYLETLERKVIPYKPDLVILGLFIDDITTSVSPYKHLQNWPGTNPFAKDASGMISRSYLWNSLKNSITLLETKYRYLRGHNYLKGIEERKKRIGPAHPGSNWHQIMYGKLPRNIYSDFSQALRKFIRICETVNIQVLVVLIPDAAQMHEPDRQKVNLFVAQTCKDIGVPLVDVTERFEKEEDPRTLYLFPLDAHTSPKGHRLIADSIFEQIEKLKLLTTRVSAVASR